LFAGASLPEGVHVNAVGSYTTDRRELDTSAVARARVAVETREVALAEAGDLVMAIEEGAISTDHLIADLQDVVRGKQVRRGPEDITVFKSVGMAFEDLVVARAAASAS
jgi:ornithine cyclodeaminase